MRIPPLYWLIFAILLMHATHIFGKEKRIPEDKILHFGAGMVVASWGSLTVPDEGIKPAVAGMCWATAAGIMKEAMDLAGYGTPEVKDLGATVLGGLVGVGITEGVKAIIRRHDKVKRHGAKRFTLNGHPI